MTAVRTLHQRLAGRTVPDPVLRQYLPNLGPLPAGADADAILVRSVTTVLSTYHAAIHG
jgi:D-tagatose 6-phosphate 4-epimerase